jgi:hypothetical protein
MITAATLLAASLAASFASSSAFAQSDSAYAYCLMTGPAQECSYTSMAQCMASKRGNADFCEPNTFYSWRRGDSRMPQ